MEEMSQYIKDGVNGLHSTKLTTIRMRTLLEKGPKCVACKTTGNIWALQRGVNDLTSGKYHLNLWSFKYNKDQILIRVMMTRDHIIPRFHNGNDSFDNSQCMCHNCNHAKGNSLNEQTI